MKKKKEQSMKAVQLIHKFHSDGKSVKTHKKNLLAEFNYIS